MSLFGIYHVMASNMCLDFYGQLQIVKHINVCRMLFTFYDNFATFVLVMFTI